KKPLLWASKDIAKMFIKDAGNMSKSGDMDEIKVCYKKVRDDLIIVQLSVPMQKRERNECLWNSLYYSSLFAASDSLESFLKNIWKNTIQTAANIARDANIYNKPKHIFDVVKMDGIFKEVGETGIYRLLMYEGRLPLADLKDILRIAKKTVDPSVYFSEFKRPLVFISGTYLSGGGGHAISGRIEWIPNTNIKVLFFSDSWQKDNCIIDYYAKEFSNLVDALTTEKVLSKELLGIVLKIKDRERQLKQKESYFNMQREEIEKAQIVSVAAEKEFLDTQKEIEELKKEIQDLELRKNEIE
ncbi:hypothetical protein ACFLYA_02170, partial [Candidatus Dependentiae bacterium]